MFTHVQCCDIVPSLVSSFGESLDTGLYFAPQLPRGFDHFYGAGRGGEPPPPHSAGRGGEPPPPRGEGSPRGGAPIPDDLCSFCGVFLIQFSSLYLLVFGKPGVRCHIRKACKLCICSTTKEQTKPPSVKTHVIIFDHNISRLPCLDHDSLDENTSLSSS